MRSDGAQCFSAFICNPVKVSGCRVTPASESDLEGVPKIYSHFSDVFSKGSADSLPPHREYNLKIDVDESTKPPLDGYVLTSDNLMPPLGKTNILFHLFLIF